MAVVFDEGLLKTSPHVFWTDRGYDHDLSDSSDAYVPGVNDVGNRRPHKINQWKTREARAKAQRAEVRLQRSEARAQGSETLSERSQNTKSKPPVDTMKKNVTNNLSKPSEGVRGRHTRKPSLKDLCAEDKLRVANLIKELAKIGEEKEKAVEQMHQERLDFEKQILGLLEQQESILNERQTIQSQLLMCQEALTVYQHKLQEREEVAEDKTNKAKSAKSSSKVHRTERSSHASQTSSSEARDEDSDDVVLTRRKHQRKRDKHKADSDRDRVFSGSRGDKPSRTEACIPDSHRYFEDDIRPLHEKNEDRGVTQRSEVNPSKHRTSSDVIIGDRLGQLSNHFKQMDFEEAGENRKEIFRTPPRSKCVTKRLSRGPLPEPIMSSTQKSSEIFAEMSFRSRSSVDNFIPLQADTSLTTRDNLANSFPGRYPTSREGGAHKNHPGNRVNFLSEDQYSDDGPFHSPNLGGKNLDGKFADPNFVAYYRKLNSHQRKQELLSQRNTLLNEQKRLRQILLDQETMLKVKRRQLHQQQLEQAQRLAHFEETGAFPLADEKNPVLQHSKVLANRPDQLNQRTSVQPQPLALSEKPAEFRMDGELNARINNNLATDNLISDIDSASPRSENHVRFKNGGKVPANPIEVRSKAPAEPDSSPHRALLISTSTSPIHTSPDRRIPVTKSPIRDETSPRAQTRSPRGHVDAATSYSRLSTSPNDRQDNLPFISNRQKSATRQGLNTSTDKKGFSVLEILEKLESEADTSLRSNSSAQPNSSLLSKGYNSILKDNSATDPLVDACDEESLAELEESKVLEDVFFLK